MICDVIAYEMLSKGKSSVAKTYLRLSKGYQKVYKRLQIQNPSDR
jgi:hypothetical protein